MYFAHFQEEAVVTVGQEKTDSGHLLSIEQGTEHWILDIEQKGRAQLPRHNHTTQNNLEHERMEALQTPLPLFPFMLLSRMKYELHAWPGPLAYTAQTVAFCVRSLCCICR